MNVEDRIKEIIALGGIPRIWKTVHGQYAVATTYHTTYHPELLNALAFMVQKMREEV